MQHIAQLQADHIGLPNAFSLNINGKNEVFKALNITHQVLLAFIVITVMGSGYFLRCSRGNDFNGTFADRPCKTGTYYYALRYHLPGSDAEYVLKGDVVLVRRGELTKNRKVLMKI